VVKVIHQSNWITLFALLLVNFYIGTLAIYSFHFFHLLKNTNFTMHLKHSQRPSVLADANSINQSLDNQLAFFTHLRIVFHQNLVNIKRLPPLIYHFNFSELFFTLFKKKTCENGTSYTSRSTNK
jgi:hypothetical protein